MSYRIQLGTIHFPFLDFISSLKLMGILISTCLELKIKYIKYLALKKGTHSIITFIITLNTVTEALPMLVPFSSLFTIPYDPVFSHPQSPEQSLSEL